MKRLIILMAMILLLIPVNIWAQQGVNIYPKAQAGVLLQRGHNAEFGYSISGLIPIKSMDSTFRHLIGIEPNILYSDFGGDLYMAKAYIDYERPFFTIGKTNFQIGLGYGGWLDMRSGENDQFYDAAQIYIGTKLPYMDILASAEVARMEGPDLFFVGLTLKYTK